MVDLEDNLNGSDSSTRKKLQGNRIRTFSENFAPLANHSVVAFRYNTFAIRAESPIWSENHSKCDCPINDHLYKMRHGF